MTGGEDGRINVIGVEGQQVLRTIGTLLLLLVYRVIVVHMVVDCWTKVYHERYYIGGVLLSIARSLVRGIC